MVQGNTTRSMNNLVPRFKNSKSKLTPAVFLSFLINHGRRVLNTQADDGFSSWDHKAKRPFYFLRRGEFFSRIACSLFGLSATKLLEMGEHDVHMPIKCEHLSDERERVVQRDFELPVDVRRLSLLEEARKLPT